MAMLNTLRMTAMTDENWSEREMECESVEITSNRNDNQIKINAKNCGMAQCSNLHN